MPNKNKIKVVAILGQDLLQRVLYLAGMGATENAADATAAGAGDSSVFSVAATPNLHRLASDGCSGMLHLRGLQSGDDAAVWLLRQLLGLQEDLDEELRRIRDMAAADEDAPPAQPGTSCTTIATPQSPVSPRAASASSSGNSGSKVDARHHGMRFCVWTESQPVLQWLHDDMRHDNCRLFDDITREVTAEDVLLKLQDQNVDVVLIHARPRAVADAAAASVASSMDALVHGLLDAQQRPDSINHGNSTYRLYITALASGPARSTSEEAGPGTRRTSAAAAAFMPVQSYQLYRGKPVVGVQDRPGVMFSSLLPGVTRIDANTRFEETSISENAGMRSILADHFFDELSYIVGYSPKYGA